MPYPEIIDFDKIANQARLDISKAINGWLRGQPHEEVALMNRITEQLSISRRKCDVGVRMPVSMESKVYVLHRKGSKGRDQYGSDLAITISVPEQDWIKTALFQIKLSRNTSVLLERHQIYEASRDKRILERTYIFAVDDQRGLPRIKGASQIWDIFNSLPNGQATHTIDCTPWDGLVYWLHQWLHCAEGAESKLGDSNGVESLLQSFISEPNPLISSGARQAEQLGDFLPARSWMQIIFAQKFRP